MKGKLPPQAIDVEKSVLGAMLIDREATPVVIELLESSSFYDPRHQRFFQAMESLFKKGEPVDVVTVTAELRRQGTINVSEDPLYLTELTMDVTTSANIEYHSRIVLEKAMMRNLIGTASEIATRAFDETEDAFELLENARHKFMYIGKEFVASSTETLGGDVSAITTRMHKMKEGKYSDLKQFGLRDLDRYTGGLWDGDLILLQGLEKSGKTTLALQILEYNASHGCTGLLFSQEMTREQLQLRYAIMLSGVNFTDMLQDRSGVRDDDWRKLFAELDKLKDLNIFVNDHMNTVETIYAETGRQIEKNKIQLVVVDYLQIVLTKAEKGKTREREVAEVAAGLKRVAKDFNVPVLALSQVNDDMRSRESRAPEQAMDKQIVIRRNEDMDMHSNGFPVDIKIRQRMGMSGNFGDIKLWYLMKTGTFANYDAGISTQEGF